MSIFSKKFLFGADFQDEDFTRDGKPKKKGKSGNYSTNAKILDELALDYAIAANILEHRQLMKLKTITAQN